MIVRGSIPKQLTSDWNGKIVAESSAAKNRRHIARGLRHRLRAYPSRKEEVETRGF
jgi:hypothetical protein